MIATIGPPVARQIKSSINAPALLKLLSKNVRMARGVCFGFALSPNFAFVAHLRPNA